MNRTHQKELTKEVRKLLKKRDEYAMVSKRQKLFLRFMALVAMWGTGLSFGYGLYTFRSAADTRIIDATYIWLWAVSILCSGLFFFLLSLSPPSDGQRLDSWFLWRGRLTLTLGVGVWVVQIINQMLPTEVNFFGNNRYIIVIGYLCLAIFLMTVAAVLARPELFLAERLTSFASGCLTFAILTSPIRLLSLLPLQVRSVWLMSALLLILVLLIGVSQRQDRKRLNAVQLTTISMINPTKLLQSLRTHDEVIRDQLRALEVKLKLEEDIPPGVLKEVIRLLVEDKKSANEALWWIIPAVVFIVYALAESLINDLLYEEIVKPFVCQFVKVICD